MVFSSSIFLFVFLPLTLALYFFAAPKYKNIFLLASSLVFYSWCGVQYTLLVAALCVVNYFCGTAIGTRAPGEPASRKVKAALIISIMANFLTLGFFKYFNFFIDNIEALAHVLGFSGFTVNAPNIPLPIGISFFIFTISSYIADLYRGQVKPQKSLANLMLYLFLFPQMLAGPIVRYADIAKAIDNRITTVDDVFVGSKRFITGLAKKVFIANIMGHMADEIIGAPGLYSTAACWFGIICYALQIYYDFSAYSDMAIGLSQIFGFRIRENFNYPYISRTVQEFWRRWHISLSTWFREYLYIPLGGNRKGRARTYLNLLIVFFATGLWHGASWNFVIWGLWHGLFLVIERLGLGNLLKKIPAAVGHIYTILVFLVGWVLFRIEDMGQSLHYIKTMFVLNTDHWSHYFMLLDRENLFFLMVGLVFSAPVFSAISGKISQKFKNASRSRYEYAFEVFSCAGYLMLLIVSTFYVAGSGFNPFIYFRF